MLGKSLSTLFGVAAICLHFTQVYGDDQNEQLNLSPKSLAYLLETYNQQFEAADAARRILAPFTPNKTEIGLSDLERLYRIAIYALKEGADDEDLKVSHDFAEWWAVEGSVERFNLRNDADNFYAYVVERNLGYIKDTAALVDWEKKTAQEYMDRVGLAPSQTEIDSPQAVKFPAFWPVHTPFFKSSIELGKGKYKAWTIIDFSTLESWASNLRGMNFRGHIKFASNTLHETFWGVNVSS